MSSNGWEYAQVRTSAAFWILFVEMESWDDQQNDDFRIDSGFSERLVMKNVLNSEALLIFLGGQ